MNTEYWDELVAQVESHGPEKIICWLETDDGGGSISVVDVIFEDGYIKVTFV